MMWLYPTFLKSIRAATTGFIGLLGIYGFALAEDPLIEYKPLKFGGVQEVGSIYQGAVAYDGKLSSLTGPELNNEWVDHFGTFLEQEVIVNQNLNLRLGLGGVFQFPKPEYVFEEFRSSMYKLFFVGPSVAKATYAFGDPDNPIFSLGGGLFPYKYNPDAVDLGEYLFRSTPYPTTLFTGGLLFVNDNAAYLQGLHGNLRFGGLSLDAILSTEMTLPPLYDWSIGVVGTYSIADGILEIGTGFKWNRMIAVDPEKTKPDTLVNAAFFKNNQWYYASTDYYIQQADFYRNLAATSSGPDSIAIQAIADDHQADVDSLAAWLNSPNVDSVIPESTRKYYTPAGLILMGRMSLDLGKLTGMESEGPFKLFAEAALLGWKEYPVFYENRWERVPVMVGAHIPTFGLLDQVTFQFEYFNSPWSNNSYNLGGGGGANLGLPVYPEAGDPLYSKSEYNDLTKHDNLAWAIYLRKEVYSHLNLSVQFARDHLRTVGTSWFYGGRLEPAEILYRNSSWYWMAQLGWSL